MVRGQLLALLPYSAEGLLAQRLSLRRHRGVDRGPTVRRYRCAHPPPAKPAPLRTGGQTSGSLPRPPSPWPPLRGPWRPTSRARPTNSAANLLAAGTRPGVVPLVRPHLARDHQELDDPAAHPVPAEQFQRLGLELVRPVEIASHGGRQGKVVERVTRPPVVPELSAHVCLGRCPRCVSRAMSPMPSNAEAAPPWSLRAR